jgi:hypothetical protein
MFYNARYYDATLGRFISPDTIVPGSASGSIGYDEHSSLKPLTVDFHELSFLSGLNAENVFTLQHGFWFQLSDEELQKAKIPFGPLNSQALNRYTYVLNNPMLYTDPLGHCPGCAALIGDGIIIIGLVALTYLTYDYYYNHAAGTKALANSISNGIEVVFSKGDGGASQAAQHLSMLLGGTTVAGYGSHAGAPDLFGRDRKHNAEGLRNALRSIQDNMRSGETIEDFLMRQGWTQEETAAFTQAAQDYLYNVLPADVEWYGVSSGLQQELLNIAVEIGLIA